mgnify:FL=1
MSILMPTINAGYEIENIVVGLTWNALIFPHVQIVTMSQALTQQTRDLCECIVQSAACAYHMSSNYNLHLPAKTKECLHAILNYYLRGDNRVTLTQVKLKASLGFHAIELVLVCTSFQSQFALTIMSL